MEYSIEQLAKIIDGKIIRKGTQVHVSTPLLDSRIPDIQADAVFFAIKGKQHDGHQYLTDLALRGLQTAVVSEDVSLPEHLLIHLIKVEDTTLALQQWATFHRAGFEKEVIAITGSNGKTIVKEWLFQLLREDLNIVRSPKSYNSQVGVPLSVLQTNENHELAIFEAGISHPGEMEKLELILQPNTGILTNIGHAHSENFVDRNQHLEEKCRLFPSCNTIVYNADDKEIDTYLNSHFPKKNLLSWGKSFDCYLRILQVVPDKKHTRITVDYKKEMQTLLIPFSDKASIENALTCSTYLLYRGMSFNTLRQRLLQLTPIEMRLELLTGNNNCMLINDAYSSDIASLRIALDFLHQQKQELDRTVILSDILQDRQDPIELYAQVGKLLNEKKIDRLIGIGTSVQAVSKWFEGEKFFFDSTAEFLHYFQPSMFHDEMILVKGARSFGFERIIKKLQQKTHETVLEINLNAMAHNLSWYRSKLEKGTKIMAMVKAFSYGSGSAEVASLLEFNRCDYLAVAYADEGVDLRRAGIRLPIMVMNPVRGSFETMMRYQLEPEIYSFTILRELIETIEKGEQQEISIHIKIDTGMHRLGFLPEEVEEMLTLLKVYPQIKVVSVFSHLAASDISELDDFSREQMRKLHAAYKTISDELGYHPMKHILNSAGITRFPEAHWDMVRLGIGLYGISSAPEDQKNLQPVSTLKTIVSQIKEVNKEDTVGYSRNGKLHRRSRIATLPIGYADGFSRKLGNGNGHVLINGQRAKTVGNICMDMCMIDITDLKDVSEGDEVIVFGKELSVNELASACGTIAYEILTSISARVKRVYVRE